VRVRIEGERELIFGDVVVRVNPNYRLSMHIDTDEGNAANVRTGMTNTARRGLPVCAAFMATRRSVATARGATNGTASAWRPVRPLGGFISLKAPLMP